jgi:uncharacterized protein (TIRG00374 family)
VKKFILNFIKIAITIGLFYYLLKDQNITELGNRFLSVDLFLFVLAFIVYFFAIYIFAFRWNKINEMYQVQRPINELSKHHFIAFFFNNFLPSSVGGDFWRVKYLIEITDKKTKSLVIVILERIAGFIATFIIGSASIIVFKDYFGHDFVVESLVLILFSYIIVILIFTKKTYYLLDKIINKFSFKFKDKMLSSIDMLKVIPNFKKQFLLAIMFSFFSILIYSLSCTLIIYSLQNSIEYWQILVIIPMVYIITMIPISINGLGLREGVYISALQFFAISKPDAVAIAFLLTFQQLLLSLIGGVLFFIDKQAHKKPT